MSSVADHGDSRTAVGTDPVGVMVEGLTEDILDFRPSTGRRALTKDAVVARELAQLLADRIWEASYEQ